MGVPREQLASHLETAFLALVDRHSEVAGGVARTVEPVDAEVAQHVFVAVRTDSKEEKMVLTAQTKQRFTWSRRTFNQGGCLLGRDELRVSSHRSPSVRIPRSRKEQGRRFFVLYCEPD